MSSISLTIGLIILIFISIIIIYNAIMNQPIFSIPWSNENTILKNNIYQNISELQKQIDKISYTEINNIKDNIIPSIQKTLEKNIEDVKKINSISTIDNLKNETKIFIINTYTKDGTQIRWTVKGDDNGNLCISDTKNMACIDKETGFLFNDNNILNLK